MPIYMKFEGVDGTVAGKYAKYIELESASLTGSKQVSSPVGQSGGGGRGTAGITEILITKALDVASTRLYDSALTGSPVKVTIIWVNPKNKNADPYMKVELEGTMISNYHAGGRGGDKVPIESLSLSFTKANFTVTPGPVDAKYGTERVSHDLMSGP